MYYIGERFGRLTVIKYHHKKNTRNFVLCRCDCGKEKIISASDLKTGRTKSCGCLNRERLNQRTENKIKNEKLRCVWVAIRQRCNNPKNKDYKNYGARGIKVCQDWDDKKAFRRFEMWALSNGYKPGLTIDRINNDGNYTPDNCRWVDIGEQNNNKRTNVKYMFNGELLSITQINKVLGFPHGLLGQRLLAGWSFERATTEKIHTNCQHKL